MGLTLCLKEFGYSQTHPLQLRVDKKGLLFSNRKPYNLETHLARCKLKFTLGHMNIFYMTVKDRIVGSHLELKTMLSLVTFTCLVMYLNAVNHKVHVSVFCPWQPVV